MVLCIADGAHEHSSLGKAPLIPGSGKLIVIPTQNNGLQRQIFRSLKHSKVAATFREIRLFIYINNDICGHVMSHRRAISMQYHHRAIQF